MLRLVFPEIQIHSAKIISIIYLADSGEMITAWS